MAIQIHPLIFEIPCFAAQRALKCDTYDRPGRSPAFAEVLAHRLRMLCSTDRPIPIVVNLDVFRSPCQRAWKIGGEAQTYGRSKALWPWANLTKGALAPVHGTTSLPISPPPISQSRAQGLLFLFSRWFIPYPSAEPLNNWNCGTRNSWNVLQ
jgi:hypothetical protein